MLGRKWIGCGSVYLFLCILSVLPANAGQTDLAQFLLDLRYLQASFTQISKDASGRLLEQSSGQLSLQRPGQFYLHYQDPYMQEIVSNGDTLWIYDHDLQQVSIHDAASLLSQTPMAILSGQADLSAHFVLVPPVTGAADQWVTLQPKSNESPYQSIRLRKQAETLQIVLIDQIGQLTQLELTSMRYAQDLRTYNFTIPAGIDVIDNRP